MNDIHGAGIAYGRLLESAHFSSYGFERLCDSLKYLLDEDRWRQLGRDWDINEFLATIDLSSLNLGKKRPELIKRIKELQPDASQRTIAKVMGVGQATVNRDLRDSSDSPGVGKPLKHKGREAEDDSYESPAADNPLKIKDQEIASDPNGSWLDKPASETATALRAAAKTPHVSYNTGETRWYTPRRYIDMAVAVMGGIDCDPASSDKANETVRASTYYTIEDDGLTKPWHGRVWMNPPYSHPAIDRFCEAAAGKYMSGEISEAIVLVNNATDTEWFQGLARASSALCFLNGRICFINHEGAPGQSSPIQGQALLYLGKRADEFAEVFANEGLVYVGNGSSATRTSSGRPDEVLAREHANA
jgi:phage N-6-adenine-methyltransferase